MPNRLPLARTKQSDSRRTFPRFAVLMQLILPSSTSAETASSPGRKVPPASSNAFLRSSCARIPGTEGGIVPTNITFAGIISQIQSMTDGLPKPKTSGRMTISSPCIFSLTRLTNCFQLSSLSMTLAMLTERISDGFTRRRSTAGWRTVSILHDAPLFSKPAATKEVLKSRKPAKLTIRALPSKRTSAEEFRVLSVRENHAGLREPEGVIL